MNIDYKVPREEKDFLIEHCPCLINKNTFKKFYCFYTAKEIATKRDLLFFPIQNKFVKPDEIGNLIVLASGLNSDIVIILTKAKSIALEQVTNWLNKITDKKFVLTEI